MFKGVKAQNSYIYIYIYEFSVLKIIELLRRKKFQSNVGLVYLPK